MKILIENKSKKEIVKYLVINKNAFFEPLSKRVDINNYAEKLVKFSKQFWLYEQDECVGFMAVYMNDFKTKYVYISTISIISQYQGRGGGTLMLKKLEEEALKSDFYKIRLEVSIDNKKAIKFYRKLGFYIFERKLNTYLMEKPLLKSYKGDIKVSICSLSYNHVKYVEKALRSFLNQRTNFRFEIIIHDDASTDGTTEIIESFKKKHPEIINVIFQKENKYSKGKKPIFEFVFPLAHGKYIALCETDDYWIDPFKLQKQVDFMEKNPDVVICGTESIIRNEITNIEIKPINTKIKYFDFYDFIRGSFVNTLTVLFRNPGQIPSFVKKCSYTDYCLWMFLLKKFKGKAVKLPDITAVYRVHRSGVYSGKRTFKKDIEILETRLHVIKFLGDNSIISKYISFYLSELLKLVRRSLVYLVRIFIYLKFIVVFFILKVVKKSQQNKLLS